MFGNLRDKFQIFQENLTTALKGLSTNDTLNRRQSTNENILVNLNAGTDILERFQAHWSDLHKFSHENATRAEDVNYLICKLDRKVKKKWRDLGQLTSCITSLSQVVHDVGELSKKMLSLEALFDAVETALSQLEDILDTRDFQNRQLEQRFQLALYEEKKLASLEGVRLKLAENLSEKVKRHEARQEKLLRECRMASEENFKEDLKVYKETKMVPKIEFAKSKNKSSNSEVEKSALEDIILDSEDASALDEFLNDSKDSLADSTNVKSAVDKNVLEDIILNSENQSAEGECLDDSKDSQST